MTKTQDDNLEILNELKRKYDDLITLHGSEMQTVGEEMQTVGEVERLTDNLIMLRAEYFIYGMLAGAGVSLVIQIAMRFV